MQTLLPLTVAALLLAIAPALAQGSGPTVRGARAAALGNASAALSGEVWAVGNNVAGLGTVRQRAVGFYAENRYFSPALNVAALAVALPLGVPGTSDEAAAPDAPATLPTAPVAAPVAASHGVVGLEAQRFGGSLYNETRAAVGYGYRFGQISLGARVEALQISIEGLGSRRVVLGSLGGQAELLPGKLTLGMYLYNLNQARLATYQDERVPTVLRAGLAYRPTAQVLLLAESEKDVERPATFKAGLEYAPVPVLAVRLGLATATEQVSAGVGLRPGSFQLDYAAAFQSALGFSQHVSVVKTWGGTN